MKQTLEPERCFRALSARDRRLDGLFFVGVSTTGSYFRPVCTARTPRQERCAFYRTAAEAERAGFRACLVCHPELAPGSATAVSRIEGGVLNESSIEGLAEEPSVTSRHLRRAMKAGVRRLAEGASTRRAGAGTSEAAASRTRFHGVFAPAAGVYWMVRLTVPLTERARVSHRASPASSTEA